MEPIAWRPQSFVRESGIITKLTTRPGVAAVKLCGNYCVVRGANDIVTSEISP